MNLRPVVHYSLPPKSIAPVAIDTELFNLDPRQLHRPKNSKLACVTFCNDGQNVYVVTDPEKVSTALYRVAGACWYMHNSNFDLRHLSRWADIPTRQAGTLYDTLIYERLMWSGWYDSFGLDDLARRYLNLRLPKEIRKTFYKATELTDEQVQYAAMDAAVTWHVAMNQQPTEEEFSVWENIDFPALMAIQDFKGIRLDVKAWKALSEEARARMEELRGQAGFNLGSIPQTQAALKKRKISLESTEEKYLLPYKDDPFVAMLLEFRDCQKRAGTYGENILEMLENGYLYPNFEPTEAVTGRTTSDGPNLQNMPHDPRYRRCFIASFKHRLVGGDYSLEEAFLAVMLHQDPAVWNMFTDQEDIHQAVGDAIGQERYVGKRIHFGLLYGLTPYGLSEQLGRPVDECHKLVRDFFDKFPGIERWMTKARAEALKTGKVSTMGGRVMHLNLYGKHWPNHAVNTPIQGTAADVMKVALGNLHKIYGRYLPVVATVHDEILMDVPTIDAKHAQKNLLGCMVNAMEEVTKNYTKPDHRIADVYVGRTWAEKDE